MVAVERSVVVVVDDVGVVVIVESVGLKHSF